MSKSMERLPVDLIRGKGSKKGRRLTEPVLPKTFQEMMISSKGEGLPTYKIGVLGGGGAGKSSLMVRLLTGEYVEDSDPTLFDEYDSVIDYQGYAMKVIFLDCAGQEQYKDYRIESIEQCQAYILVYDVGSSLSFEEMDEYLNEICKSKVCDCDEIPIVIVGNKIDLPRKVKYDHALAYAIENDCKLIETSASTNQHVNEMITLVLEELIYYAFPHLCYPCTFAINNHKPSKRIVRLEGDQVIILKGKWEKVQGKLAEIEKSIVKSVSIKSIQRTSKGKDNHLCLYIDEETSLHIYFQSKVDRDAFKVRLKIHKNVLR